MPAGQQSSEGRDPDPRSTREFDSAGLGVLLGLPTAFVLVRVVDPTGIGMGAVIFWAVPAVLMMAVDFRLRHDQGRAARTHPIGILVGWSLTFALWAVAAGRLLAIAWMPAVILTFILLGGILVWVSVQTVEWLDGIRSRGLT